ncbi:unnamed protein product [Pylaiella littoralis]
MGEGTTRCHRTSTLSAAAAVRGGGERSVAVTFRYCSGLYHHISGLFPIPHVLFLFNAGLWGYDDWEPTLEHVLGCSSSCSSREHDEASHSSDDDGGKVSPRRSPAVVVTSYCSEEASDDMDTIERVLLGQTYDGRCNTRLLGRSTNDACATSGIVPQKKVGVGGMVEWLWEPEVNPHRSLVPRRTECGVEGRVLFENHSWQALRRSCGRGVSPPTIV